MYEKNKTKGNNKGSIEDAINSTNPITLSRDFGTGLYGIIDDCLTTYESIYNIIDKLTDNTVCTRTLPGLLSNVCQLHNQFHSFFKIIGDFPRVIAKAISRKSMFLNFTLVESIINTIIKGLNKFKKDIYLKLELDKVDICEGGSDLQKVTDKLCLYLGNASESKLLSFLKKIGIILIIFKRHFNKLEPIFTLEVSNPIKAIQKISKVRGELSQDLKGVKEDLEQHVGELTEEAKATTSSITSLIPVAKKTGEHSPAPHAAAVFGGGKLKMKTNILYNYIVDPRTNYIYNIQSPEANKIFNKYKQLLNL